MGLHVVDVCCRSAWCSAH